METLVQEREIGQALWQEFFARADATLASGNSQLVPSILASGGDITSMVAAVRGEMGGARISSSMEGLWSEKLEFSMIKPQTAAQKAIKCLPNLERGMYQVGQGLKVLAVDCDVSIEVIQVLPLPYVSTETVLVRSDGGVSWPDPLLIKVSKPGGEAVFGKANLVETAAVDAMLAAASRNDEVRGMLRIISEMPNNLRGGVNVVREIYRRAPGEVTSMIRGAEAACNAFRLWVAALGDLYRSYDQARQESVAAVTGYLTSAVGGAFLRGFEQGKLVPVSGGIAGALAILVAAGEAIKVRY